MAIFRVEKSKDYTVMSNHHLRNSELSLKAKGLLSQILSLPEGWDYTLAGLAAINREGLAAVRSAVQELEAAGYILRRQTRDATGKLSGNEYVIYEQPVATDQSPAEPEPDELPAEVSPEDVPLCDFPTTDNPSTENPLSENQTQLNKDISGKDKIKKKNKKKKKAATSEPKPSPDELTAEQLRVKVTWWIHRVAGPDWTLSMKEELRELIMAFYDPTRKITNDGPPPTRSEKGFTSFSDLLLDFSKGEYGDMRTIINTAIAGGWRGIRNFDGSRKRTYYTPPPENTRKEGEVWL